MIAMHLGELAQQFSGVGEGDGDGVGGGDPPGADGLAQADGGGHEGAGGADEAAVQLGQFLVVGELDLRGPPDLLGGHGADEKLVADDREADPDLARVEVLAEKQALKKTKQF